MNKPDNITITVRDAVSFVVQDTENQSPDAYCEWSPPSVKGAVSLFKSVFKDVREERDGAEEPEAPGVP